MESLKYLPRYTVSDYQLWEGDWELIEGHAVSMSPTPVYEHQRVAIVLSSQLEYKMDCKEMACRDCKTLYELDWIVNANTVLRPDIAIVCGHTGDFITKPPVLIIEILSPSTALRDMHVKREIYQAEGVKYYIIADSATRTIQAYTLVKGQYQPHDNALYAIRDGCSISIDFTRAIEEMRG